MGQLWYKTVTATLCPTAYHSYSLVTTILVSSWGIVDKTSRSALILHVGKLYADLELVNGICIYGEWI